MSDDTLDRLVAGARDELRSSLNPSPPDLGAARRRAHTRRRAIVGFVATVALFTVGVVVNINTGDSNRSPRVVAGPGPGGGNAGLLAPGELRALPPSPLSGRSTMAAVWTGKEMLVWGGDSPHGQVGDGAGYTPRTNTWRMLPSSPLLSPRNAPAAVWTGQEMLLWGGTSSNASFADGASFNPDTGSWREIASAPFTSAGRPQGAWTGTEMLVLAGFNSRQVAAYDPTTDRWRSLPDLPGQMQAPNPAAVWTGSRLVVVVQSPDPNLHEVVMLDPHEKAWVPAPQIDSGQVVVAWTGETLVAIVGGEALVLDPGRRTWTHLASAPDGAGVGDTTAVWTGTQVLLWEGGRASVVDPARRTWEVTPTGGLAQGAQPAAVWADGVLLTWGGFPDQATGVMLRPRLSETSSTFAPTTVPDPDAAGSALQSPQERVDGTLTVLATYVTPSSAGATGRIDVLEWRSEWKVVASFDVSAPGVLQAPATERPLLVHDVTGDGEPDFIVPLEAASTDPYEVISNDSGVWRQVPFGTDNHIVVLEPDAPTADRFVTSSNLCTPSCADGHYRREQWKYSASEKLFVVERDAICDRLASGGWKCDPPNSPLAAGKPIGHQ